MVKILIIQWIIIHCDRRSFLGMQWEDREKGIFWLYWKHQSSRSCKENTSESSSLYEYYRAWARHKNNNRRRQPRDLKAAFRNALEKKQELERLTHMDTKDRIYWRIKDFPNDENKCFSQSHSKKPKGPSHRSRKISNNLVQNGDEFPVNFGASTSTAVDDVSFKSRKSRKPAIKRNKKASAKAEIPLVIEETESVADEPPVNGFSTAYDDANNLNPLPPFGCLKRNDNDDGSWKDNASQSFSEMPYDEPSSEDRWNPQFFDPAVESHINQCTPPQLSSDLMEVSSTELMDLFVPNPSINYSFHPTPPQQTSDIIFDNSADLMSLEKIINGEEPTILKYSFPLQPKEDPISQSHQKNTYAHQVPATSLHCSALGLTSPIKTSNLQNNNCVIDSRIPPVNAFLLHAKQCFYDQVVPQYCGAFQTSQQLEDTSELFVNDCLLHLSSSVNNYRQMPEGTCHQQVNNRCQSIELLKYNDQTSHDDSGISDMDDFWECANKLLDDIDSKSDDPYHLML